MPLAVTNIKRWWFIGSSSFQTPQVHIPVDNTTETKEWVRNYAPFSKKCSIEDNISKIKENMDRPKITLKSAAIRNHFGAEFFLIFTVFLRWLLKLVWGTKISLSRKLMCLLLEHLHLFQRWQKRISRELKSIPKNSLHTGKKETTPPNI